MTGFQFCALFFQGSGARDRHCRSSQRKNPTLTTWKNPKIIQVLQ